MKEGRTIVGKKGDGTRLFMISSQFVSLKKACDLISTASVSPDPNRRSGSLVNSYVRPFISFRARRRRKEERTLVRMLTESLGI